MRRDSNEERHFYRIAGLLPADIVCSVGAGMQKVYFDESGNTGQNLLDSADPIFTLASCSFALTDKDAILQHFQRFRGRELKFARLRRNPEGQRAVLSMLRSDAINATSAGAVIFHKPFTVVTKYCDVIIEPSVKSAGLNFYERGLNVATANLLFTTMPTFLGRTAWTNFLSTFVQVVREKSPKLFAEWKLSAELLFSHLQNAEPYMANFIAPVLLLRDCDELFGRISSDELDPLVPAYYASINRWGTLLGERFEVYADESKALANSRNHLLKVADPSLETFTAGFDRRTMSFPLKCDSITCVDSTTHFQVQIADVLSGVIASAAKAVVKEGLKEGSFAQEVIEVCTDKGIIFEALWPSRQIDPKSLGTEKSPEPGEIDLPTYTSMVLNGHPSTRRPS